MAATLREIREAIRTVLEGAIEGLTVYPQVESVQVLPAAVVYPDDIDYVMSMRRGVTAPDIRVYVLAAAADWGIGQDTLDDLIDPYGPRSIPAAIFASRTLGLTGIDCHATHASRYGGRFEAAGIDHIGAVIHLKIAITQGAT